ncbi:MAG TPA: class I SAM-dependent methyltransferase [Acidimicrobiales bacterium]
MADDAWTSSDAYDAYVGRWSRGVAGRFVDWLGVPPARRWLEIGCGTGALTGAILEAARPAEVLGIDQAPAYVDEARSRLAATSARFEVLDAAALDVDREFDAAVSGLVLNFLPDPAAAVRSMARSVRPGGVVAAYVWDYAAGMELMRVLWDAAGELDERARELDEGRRFPLCDPGRLAGLWGEAGLGDVATAGITVPTVFADFDDYWSPFLGGQGPAPGYVASLAEDDRRRLRAAVRARLPIDADGSIALRARAWAVRGVVEGR